MMGHGAGILLLALQEQPIRQPRCIPQAACMQVSEVHPRRDPTEIACSFVGISGAEAYAVSCAICLCLFASGIADYFGHARPRKERMFVALCEAAALFAMEQLC